MDKANYTDLLEALNYSAYVVIVARMQDDKIIDWAPAADYCTLLAARLDNEWPEDAELRLIYGLDALNYMSYDDISK